jgi:hypothetical protein
MPSKSEWRDLEQGIGREAFKLEGTKVGGSTRVILAVWLVFYVLAVTHTLSSQRWTVPISTAEAQEPSGTSH